MFQRFKKLTAKISSSHAEIIFFKKSLQLIWLNWYESHDLFLRHEQFFRILRWIKDLRGFLSVMRTPNDQRRILSATLAVPALATAVLAAFSSSGLINWFSSSKLKTKFGSHSSNLSKIANEGQFRLWQLRLLWQLCILQLQICQLQCDLGSFSSLLKNVRFFRENKRDVRVFRCELCFSLQWSVAVAVWSEINLMHTGGN